MISGALYLVFCILLHSSSSRLGFLILRMWWMETLFVGWLATPPAMWNEFITSETQLRLACVITLYLVVCILLQISSSRLFFLLRMWRMETLAGLLATSPKKPILLCKVGSKWFRSHGFSVIEEKNMKIMLIINLESDKPVILLPSDKARRSSHSSCNKLGCRVS